MAPPGLEAEAVRGPVASAGAQGLSAEAAATSVGFFEWREPAFQRPDMPAGGRSDASALTAARWTRRVPATDGVIEGAVTEVPGTGLADPSTVSTGRSGSTPE